jgi:hypothetical protein
MTSPVSGATIQNTLLDAHISVPPRREEPNAGLLAVTVVDDVADVAKEFTAQIQ